MAVHYSVKYFGWALHNCSNIPKFFFGGGGGGTVDLMWSENGREH